MPRNSVQKRRWNHSCKRAMTHHNLALTQHDLQVMIRQIESAHGGNTLTVVHLERLTNTANLVAVLWNDRWLPVVYQHVLKQIKTILPSDELERRRFQPPRLPTPEDEIADFLADRQRRPVIYHAVRPT